MAETASNASQTVRYRIRRFAGGAAEWFANNWRTSQRFRLLGYIGGGVLLAFAIVWFVLTRNLPSADKLLDYQPPLPTMVRGIDGEIVYSYARERRVQLGFDDFPRPMINAFLAAEDKTFWTHGGVDYTGLLGAVVDYVSKLGSGERAKGGSTITQQVAKNVLLGDEYSVTRKLKEMIVARRIEATLTKRQILELYLNEIALGRQSFGVQAASRAYFNKDVGDLQLHEAAFLAILPKAPERYGRAQHAALALERRNYVLDQMVSNGWATPAQAAAAKAMPLGLAPNRVPTYSRAVGYFTEEVRRRLIERYGENAEDGPNSVYSGGLWVRTSLDLKMQEAARDALRTGLLRYHAGQGWKGPVAHLDLDPENWQSQMALVNKSIDYSDWRIGVILASSGSDGRIGFANGDTAALGNIPGSARVGDLVAAAPVNSSSYAVRTIPEVAGGMVVMEPQTGRVIAVQGGFDSGLDSFNRGTQALRQPGSTIKPFVYATGLDSGMTPATQILDGRFCVYQGGRLGEKCFSNFGGGGGSGNHTMRWGLEQSRNLMTVRIANDAGMDRVVKTIKTVGIGEYQPYLAFSLGAGDTTVLRMVNAYAALANHGVQFTPSLIDYVQDRKGKVIWKSDNRRCLRCNMAQWDGKPMPRIAKVGKQVMDPGTSFQTMHMLTGVIIRGTATTLKDLNLPLFGKTGTTSGPRDVWFVGGSQQYVAGVYIGFDKPRSLGGYAQGGRIAAPIFKDMVQKTKGKWDSRPFVAPAGIRMVRIDRVSGKQVTGIEPGDDAKSSIIWEAFKPNTEPQRWTKADDFAAKRDALIAQIRASRAGPTSDASADDMDKKVEARDFAEEQGGVY
jgi:penicillin-binding protein 1A